MQDQPNKWSQTWRLALCIGAAWTLLLLVSLAWNISKVRETALKMAETQARIAHDKDVVYRMWNSGHGGVYVPVTERTPPNPHLNPATREVTTTSGLRLTKVNPAYMTRQVHEIQSRRMGIGGHITSLRPIRPENAPDAWEAEALRALDAGQEEVVSLEPMAGGEALRLMRPLKVDASCLKCHADQGYQLGQVRGGISVSVPMKENWAVASHQQNVLLIAHAVIGILGLIGLGLSAHKLSVHIRQREQAEDVLKARTDALELERGNLQAIFDAVQVAMVLVNDRTEVIRINGVAARLAGKDVSDFLGRQPGDGFDCVHASETSAGCGHSDACGKCPIRKTLERVLRTGESIRGVEARITLASDEQHHVWLELNADPIEIEGVRHVLLAIADITSRKNNEESLRVGNALMCDALLREKEIAAQLEAAVEQLEAVSREAQAATQAKSEFLANTSHEIRTPLTAILGYADVLLEEGNIEKAPRSRVDALTTIRRNGEHLLGIINDILDISKIEAGRLEIECIPCSPVQVVADVVSLMHVRATAKNLVLAAEYIGAIPETFQTDPLRLKQILVNLVGNAIKFTEDGGVRIITRLVNGAKPTMQFDILDTGIGMTEEEAARMFHPFTQADSSTARRFGGTGLGLTISKRLAQMQGGEISIVQTQPGAGTQLRLTLPTGSLEGVRMAEVRMSGGSEPDDPKPATVALANQLSCRVLLAEDGPDNQRLIAHVLRKAGADVAVVENGQLAVDAAMKACEAGKPFDVILMDMQMPVMDGYTATGELRQRGYTGPIIALTAHAMASDRQKCIKAGCDDHATKPIDRKALLETIRRQLRGEPVCSASL